MLTISGQRDVWHEAKLYFDGALCEILMRERGGEADFDGWKARDMTGQHHRFTVAVAPAQISIDDEEKRAGQRLYLCAGVVDSFPSRAWYKNTTTT